MVSPKPLKSRKKSYNITNKKYCDRDLRNIISQPISKFMDNVCVKGGGWG